MGTSKRQAFEADGEAMYVVTVAGTIEKQDGNVIWLRDASGTQLREALPYNRALIDGQKVALSWVGREGGKEMFASGLLDCIDGSVTQAVPHEELLPKLELLGAKSLLERLGRFIGHFWTFGAKAVGGVGDTNAPAIAQLAGLLFVTFTGPVLLLAGPFFLVYLLTGSTLDDHSRAFFSPYGRLRMADLAVLIAGYWVVIWLPLRARARKRRRIREAVAVIDTTVKRALTSTAA
jgi:hypothetical protein